jgi:hypothetical protein
MLFWATPAPYPVMFLHASCATCGCFGEGSCSQCWLQLCRKCSQGHTCFNSSTAPGLTTDGTTESSEPDGYTLVCQRFAGVTSPPGRLHLLPCMSRCWVGDPDWRRFGSQLADWQAVVESVGNLEDGLCVIDACNQEAPNTAIVLMCARIFVCVCVCVL